MERVVSVWERRDGGEVAGSHQRTAREFRSNEEVFFFLFMKRGGGQRVCDFVFTYLLYLLYLLKLPTPHAPEMLSDAD